MADTVTKEIERDIARYESQQADAARQKAYALERAEEARRTRHIALGAIFAAVLIAGSIIGAIAYHTTETERSRYEAGRCTIAAEQETEGEGSLIIRVTCGR